jgi:hypothetical protein
MEPDRSHYAKPQDKSAMPRWFRRAADALDGSHPTHCKDYYNMSLGAGDEPLPPSAAKLEKAARHLNARGCKNVHQRMLTWRRALDMLPQEVKHRAGIIAKLGACTGIRRINAPRATFVMLEPAFEAITAGAIKARVDLFDPHDPVAPKYVKDRCRRGLVMATRLEVAGKVSTDVTPVELFSIANQTAHIRLIDKAIAQGEKIKSVCEDMEAIRFLAQRVHGPQSDPALFALAQASARRANHDMTDGRVKHLASLLRVEQLRAIRAAPEKILVEATDTMTNKPPKWRKIAAGRIGLATAVALQPELLMTSAQLVDLKFGADGMPILANYDAAKHGPLPLSGRTRRLLDQRLKLLHQLGCPIDILFQGQMGEAKERSLECATGRALNRCGVTGVSLRCLRDLGAILLLRNDPTSIRRVTVLLGMCSVKTMVRRFKPFLRGRKQ